MLGMSAEDLTNDMMNETREEVARRDEGKMINTMKPISRVFLLALALLGAPKIAGMFASAFSYEVIDPDGAFAWLYVHHLAQAAIFIVAILAIKQFQDVDFGFSWGKEKVGRRYVFLFSLFFCAYLVGSVPLYFANSLQLFAHPMTPRNIIGYLSFQLLHSGPSEELIFRAFAMTLLGRVLKGKILAGKISLANLAAAVIFGLAHVSISFAPFGVSYSAVQIVYAVVLGLFYGDCYEKTGSVFYPMMMHSITNVLSVGATIIATALLR